MYWVEGRKLRRSAGGGEEARVLRRRSVVSKLMYKRRGGVASVGEKIFVLENRY